VAELGVVSMAPRPTSAVLLTLGLVVALVCLSANHSTAVKQTWQQLALTAQHVITVPWNKISGGGPVTLVLNGNTVSVKHGTAPVQPVGTVPNNMQHIVLHLGTGVAPVAPVLPQTPAPHIIIRLPAPATPAVVPLPAAIVPVTPVVPLQTAPSTENIHAIVDAAVHAALAHEHEYHGVSKPEPQPLTQPLTPASQSNHAHELVKKAMAENTKEGAQLAEAERAPLAQVIGEIEKAVTDNSQEGAALSEVDAAISQAQSSTIENEQLRKQIAKLESENEATKRQEQESNTVLRNSATKMGAELRQNKEKYEEQLRKQAEKLTTLEDKVHNQQSHDMELQNQLHKKLDSNERLEGKVQREEIKAKEEGAEEKRVRMEQVQNSNLQGEVERLKEAKTVQAKEASLKYAALKKQKADELRDLRLKMVNEGARIKRVEEERAVRAIAKFANEDKIKLTQKDIKAAANQIEDEVPAHLGPHDTDESNIDVKFPRVYIGAHD